MLFLLVYLGSQKHVNFIDDAVDSGDGTGPSSASDESHARTD